jgi:hypothetical protein
MDIQTYMSISTYTYTGQHGVCKNGGRANLKEDYWKKKGKRKSMSEKNKNAPYTTLTYCTHL